jgi:hypothetical protein
MIVFMLIYCGLGARDEYGRVIETGRERIIEL